MQDVASHGVESHGVNKWRFMAFLIDNRGGAAERQAKGPVSKCCGSRLSKRRLVLSDPAEVKLVCELRLVQLERELRVLDLCSGMGAVPWLLTKLGVAAKVFEVEIDPVARKVAASRAPGAVQLQPHAIWHWASEEGQKRIEGMNLDLVVGGFPCQSVSVAAPKGKGLKSTSKVFWAVHTVVQAVLRGKSDARTIIECTDFSKRHPEGYKAVTKALGCESLVIDAGESEVCYRRRWYWMNFEAETPDRVEVDPNSGLEPGCTTWWEWLPTVVASGITSWSTREVVQDEWGQVGPLKLERWRKPWATMWATQMPRESP